MSAAPGLVSGGDLAVVAGQLGRRPQAMSAVAARCPFGFPAVVEDLPYDLEGRPFPTLYYCTCPTLVVEVARLESAGGVTAWTRRLAADAALTHSVLGAATAETARRRELVGLYPRLMLDGGASLETGVGGVRDVRAVKCLHAHVAHALASPGYLFGEAVIAELDALWCDDRRCAARLPDGVA